MKIIKVSYEGYLTEQKLITIFSEISKSVSFDMKTNVKIERYRGDITINNKYLIEFDGYQHYTQSEVFIRDSYKDATWEVKSEINKVIRIPYFVQLTTETFKYYFDDLLKDLSVEVEVTSNYPHGFIDKKAILPANFCSIGERRFFSEVEYLPFSVVDSIVSSLMKINKTPECVFSLNMREIEPWKSILDSVCKDSSVAEHFSNFNIYYRLNE
jgi:hypothetical protein